MSGLVRLLAALAVALVAGAFWSTPGEAHAGHGARSAAEASQPMREAASAQDALWAAEADCRGNTGDASAPTACCGDACHAMIPARIAPQLFVATTAAETPTARPPSARVAPPPSLQRPPRRLGPTAG